MIRSLKVKDNKEHNKIIDDTKKNVSKIIRKCDKDIDSALFDLNEEEHALNEVMLRLGNEKLLNINNFFILLEEIFWNGIHLCIHTSEITIDVLYKNTEQTIRADNDNAINRTAESICGCVDNHFNIFRAKLKTLQSLFNELNDDIRVPSDDDTKYLSNYMATNSDVISKFNVVYNYINSNLESHIYQFELVIDVYLLMIDIRKLSFLIEKENAYIFNDPLFNVVHQQEYLKSFFTHLLEIYEKAGKFIKNIIETNFNTINPLKDILHKKLISFLEFYTYRILEKTKLLTDHEDAIDFQQTLKNITSDSDPGIYDAKFLFASDNTNDFDKPNSNKLNSYYPTASNHLLNFNEIEKQNYLENARIAEFNINQYQNQSKQILKSESSAKIHNHDDIILHKEFSEMNAKDKTTNNNEISKANITNKKTETEKKTGKTVIFLIIIFVMIVIGFIIFMLSRN
ncbi:hypothetical protein COBT_000930 [Conglomerata obtusa]